MWQARRKAVVVCLVASFGATVAAQRATVQGPSQILPVDEAEQDSSFLAFQGRLRAAIRDRDVDTVLASVASNLVYAAAGDKSRGRVDFADHLRQNRHLKSWGDYTVWTLLEHILAQGGGFSKTHGAVSGRREFCAPYYCGFRKFRPLNSGNSGHLI